MPVVAKTVLRGDARTQGFLLSAAGVGAMMGALVVASQRSPGRLHKLMTSGGVLFGAGLIALSLCAPAGRWLAEALATAGVHLPWEAVGLWLSLAMLVCLGVGRMILMSSTNTYVQTLVDDDKRSRVMAFHALAMMGLAPLGALMMGQIAKTSLGATGAILLAGLACLAGAIAFAGHLPRIHKQ
jgi:hypothetical protein